MNAEQILRQMLDGVYADAMGSSPKIEKCVDKFIQEFKTRVQNECEQIASKFCAFAWRRRDGQVEEQFVMFVPRDELLWQIIDYYKSLCQQVAGQEQIEAVARLRQRVTDWQDKNHTKIPDAEPGECP